MNAQSSQMAKDCLGKKPRLPRLTDLKSLWGCLLQDFGAYLAFGSGETGGFLNLKHFAQTA